MTEDEAGPVSYTVWLSNLDGGQVGKQALQDPDAVSTVEGNPAFVSPPEGAPPYYGFMLRQDISFSGFTYGAITDFLEADCEDGCSIGDAFVEAPDGTRAGLVWEVASQLECWQVSPPGERSWGLYRFSVLRPIATIEDMQQAFSRMVPKLREFHHAAGATQ